MPTKTNKPATSAKSKPVEKRRRLSASERELQILTGAIKFFSARGLDGQTRDLAKEIGITHPLLYHYFPTKKALIERVYQEVYLGRWKPQWEQWLDDETIELEEKLIRFYQDYAHAILTPEWVRIFIFSGLSDGDIPNKYLLLLKKKLFPRILRETRAYLGITKANQETERETQLILGLHGGIFYLGIQQWVYNEEPPKDMEQIIKDRIRAYIASARELFGSRPTKQR
jgi:AcrR family transcriptional regulator